MVVRMTISVGPTPSDLKQSMDDVRETFDETRVDTPNTSRFPMVSTFSRQPLEVKDQVLYLDVAAFAPARAARNETRLADCCHRWPAGEVVETSQNWIWKPWQQPAATLNWRHHRISIQSESLCWKSTAPRISHRPSQGNLEISNMVWVKLGYLQMASSSQIYQILWGSETVNR